MAEWESKLVDVGRLTELRQAVPAHHPGEGKIGDCFRTAVACLLGAGQPTYLPHFVEQAITTGDLPWEDRRLARKWLREHEGVDMMTVELDLAIATELPYIVSVHSKTGPWPHCVVGRGSDVVWDPSGVAGGYTLADLYEAERVCEMLAEPYEPDPDEMVRRWRMNKAERDRVLEALADVYTPEGCAIWLAAPNKLLDGRIPDEMIDAGDAELVLNLIFALAEGVIF